MDIPGAPAGLCGGRWDFPLSGRQQLSSGEGADECDTQLSGGG